MESELRNEGEMKTVHNLLCLAVLLPPWAASVAQQAPVAAADSPQASPSAHSNVQGITDPEIQRRIASGDLFYIGNGVIGPKPTYNPDPEYSEEARRAGLSGNCLLQLIVNAKGEPENIQVLHSLGMGLDERAIQAVQQWKFEPATKESKPVASLINVQVTFRIYQHGPIVAMTDNPLESDGKDRTGKVGTVVPLGEPAQWVLPKYPKDARKQKTQGTVVLLLQIRKDGSVSSASASSGDAVLIRAASEAARKWKFVPDFQNGKPVDAQTVATFDFQLLGDQPVVGARYYAPKAPPPIGEVTKVGNGIEPPRALYHPDPEYTQSARSDGVEGKVLLALVVSREGMPRDIQVKKSLRPDMDEQAIRSVMQWRFAPATKGRVPLAVAINVEVHFRLQ